MKVTTTPTSGAAIQRYKIGYHADEWGQRSRTPSGIPDASGSWVRYADHVNALAAGQATAAPHADSVPAGGCPPLPNLDSSDEPIWEAILNWKTATPGADAVRKANKVENAIIETMRACVDADRAARAPADSVLEDAARWQALPAFFEEYQIDAMKLYRDIDAYLAAARKQGEKK